MTSGLHGLPRYARSDGPLSSFGVVWRSWQLECPHAIPIIVRFTLTYADAPVGLLVLSISIRSCRFTATQPSLPWL